MCVEKCIVSIHLEFNGVQVLHKDTTDVRMQVGSLSNRHYSHQQNKHSTGAFNEDQGQTAPEFLDYVTD